MEREARSRRSNVLEALGLATVTFVVLWPFCFGWGVLGDSARVRYLAQLPLALGFVWVFLVSPFWHRDTLESLGLGIQCAFGECCGSAADGPALG
jgi:hypothetical protein